MKTENFGCIKTNISPSLSKPDVSVSVTIPEQLPETSSCSTARKMTVFTKTIKQLISQNLIIF